MQDALDRLNWTQAELARRLGVSAEQVSRWKAKGSAPQYAMAYLGLALDLAMARDCAASIDPFPRV